MSSLIDSGAIFSYHRGMMRLYGNNSSFALGWKDTQSQSIRFKILSGLAELRAGHSVLDAGCGYGDLLLFLSQLYPEINYTGIEQIPELLDEAIIRCGNYKKANFISGNFMTTRLPPTDYIYASGSLNYRSIDDNFIFKAISRLFETCTMGFGFNLLSNIESQGLLVAYNPHEILSYCKSLSPKTILINDYADEDFTIFMYR